MTSPEPAVEQLVFAMPCNETSIFLKADASTWTSFLETQPGFARKLRLQYTNESSISTDICHLVSYVEWESREIWKSIPGSVQVKIDSAFKALFQSMGGGSVPMPVPFPILDGLSLESSLGVPHDSKFVTGEALEVNRLDVRCEDVDRSSLCAR